MKVNFIPYYFLMKIEDVPHIFDSKAEHKPLPMQDYIILNRDWTLALVYTVNLINIPTQGIGGQLIA